MVHSFFSAPAKRGRGTGRRPVEGAAAERLAPSWRRVSMVMIVIDGHGHDRGDHAHAHVNGRDRDARARVVRMMVQPLAGPRAAGIFAEDEGLDGDRHGVDGMRMRPRSM